jgi:chemotaxis signal transduction protein
MIAEEPSVHATKQTNIPEWCYLASLGGSLFALPDDNRTVLLPFISGFPQVTPLPKGLVPPYVLGLINVAQRGELLIDLPRLLGLRSGPFASSASENRRVVVVGEATPPDAGEYRLAFAIDYGYELFQIDNSAPAIQHQLGAFVSSIIDTPHGDAALLDMEEVCNTVLKALGAERLFNQPTEVQGDEQA